MLASITLPPGVGPHTIQGLPYLSTSHLAVTVNGTPVAATFDDRAKTVTLAAAPAAGAEVLVVRTTPRTEDGQLVHFLDLVTGSAGLTAALLDTDYRQKLYLLLEGRDNTTVDPDLDGLALGDDEQWDAEALRIENLSPGVAPLDAVIKSQLDTVAGAARNLPTSVLDNDDGLMVVAGEWDDQAPAPFRTALMLGSAAVLNAGVAANNAVQLDSSARYPAADGRNINLASHPTVLARALATVVSFGLQDFASPGVDPGVATWSQNVNTRINMTPGWAGRVELNNSGDVDGSSISPYRIRLTAGTWRLRWVFKPLMPLAASATNRTSLRLTNSDDTSAQIIYYDMGLHRPSVDFADLDYSVFVDSLVLTFSVASDIVFRYSNRASGGNNKCDFRLLLQRIKA